MQKEDLEPEEREDGFERGWPKIEKAGSFSMKWKIILLGIVLSLIAPALTWAEGIAVIVNETNGTSDMTIKDLSRIYSARTTEWSNGRPIVAVNRDARSDVRKDFYKKVLRSKPTQRFFLPGSPIPFRTIVQKSANGATRFVASEKNAIGYVHLTELTGNEEGIKVLKINGVMPTSETIKSGTYKLR